MILPPAPSTVLPPPPVVLAYGVGVDSTALSVENRLAHMAIAV